MSRDQSAVGVGRSYMFDTLPELAMHTGIWLMMFGTGIVYGGVVAEHLALDLGLITIFVAVIIGIPGQIAMESGDDET